MNNLKFSWQIVSISAFVIFLAMNLLTPNFTDDYAYSFVWDGEHGGNFRNDIGDLQRIENFSDIFISQFSHWLTWGGRTVAHIFVQFFSWQGKLLFDFANAIIFSILALEIYFLGTGKIDFKNIDGKILVGIFFTMWFCLPEFFQTTLWMTGSCNYLWMAVFQFAFLIPFALKFFNDKFKINTELIVLLGLLAGWSNEAGSAMILFITFFAIIYFLRRKKLERWMLAGFFAAIIGFAFLILAPGNFNREALDSEELTFFEMLADNFLYGFLPVMIGNLILLVPIILYFLRGKKSSQTSLYIFAFFVTGIFLPCLLMIAPMFPARAAFCSPIFLIIASIVAIKNISIQIPKKILYAVGIFWIVTIFYALAVDFSVHQQISERQEYISAHKNDEVITVQPIMLPIQFTEKIFWSWTLTEESRFYNDITPYMRINRNKTTAKHFGVKNIVADEVTWKHLQDLNQLVLYDN